MVESDLAKLARVLRAQPDYAAFESVYSARLVDRAVRIPKALDANFMAPHSSAEEGFGV